jgi:predicted peptidase
MRTICQSLILFVAAGFLSMAGCAHRAGMPLSPAPDTASSAATGFLNQYLEAAAANPRYVLYVPREYTPEKAWPLIVFLHGAGERGDDGLVQTEVGIGTALRRYPDRYPALVLMPQCPEDRFWDVMLGDIEAMMARTEAAYNIDEDRIYLTGLSMGGYGTWLWGAMKTDTFAALMPICGGGTTMDIGGLGYEKSVDFGTLKERVQHLARIPVWAFHGADDTVVPPLRSRQMAERIEKAGGDVHYTEFPGTGHNSWDPAYRHKKATNWLFRQRKE